MSAAAPSNRPLPHYHHVDDTLFALTVHEPRPEVPEAFVQDLWRYQRYDATDLRAVGGRTLRVLDPGELNTDRGPDFLNARLLIDGVEWVGAVEVHVQSGGWYAHDHHLDATYDSVVLHVTLYPDMWTGGLLRADESSIPELVLADRLQQPLRALLHAFLKRPDAPLPCAAHWPEVPTSLKTSVVRSLGQQRLRDKAGGIGAQYEAQPAYDELLYLHLARGLGFSKNSDPMTLLAQRIPLRVARAEAGDPQTLDALFLGTARLIPAMAELTNVGRRTIAYVEALHERYSDLHARYDLQPVSRQSWQFFRLRPANFPPLRIAQLAACFHPGGLLRDGAVDRLLQGFDTDDPVAAWTDLLMATTPPPFWRTHYRLGAETDDRSPALGKARIRRLITNAILPLLLLYAEQQENPPLTEALVSLLSQLPAERDAITRRFKAVGDRPRNALMAQGYHALYRSFCTKGRCLSCAIGQHIVENGASPSPRS